MLKLNFRRLLIVFGVIILLILSVGCGMSREQEADYVALEIGTFDADDGGLHISEFSIWDEKQTNYHQDITAAEHASVTFNGTTYTGDYQRSATEVPNLYVSHRYKGDKVFFEVNGTTGELSSIIFAYEPSKSASLSQEQCRTIADSIADDYIDIDEYCIGVRSQPIYSNYLYAFTYYREISGYKTADSLTISIDGNGKVSYFGKNMLGSFEEIESVSVDDNKAKSTLDAKLESIYRGNSQWKSYTVNHVVLIKLNDGTCAFLYTVDNEFKDGEFGYGSLVQILVRTSHTS